MKFLFVALLALTLSVLLALQAYQDPGFVFISRGDWSLETSFSLLLTVLVVGFFLVYAVIRTTVALLRSPRRYGDWRRERRAVRAREVSQRGLVELAEGRWEKAERDLIKSATHSEAPLLNYLGAARAAQKQDADQRWDKYLSLAHATTPQAELAIGLTQAEVQLSNHQLEQALATLMHLRSIAPRNTHVLQLLHRLYEELNSWEDLVELLPELRRNAVFDEKQLIAVERKTYQKLLVSITQSGDVRRLKASWAKLPRALRQDPELLDLYAGQLAGLGEGAEAERLLREGIKRSWDARNIRLYGLVRGEDPARQLAQAENWLKANDKNTVLLLTLGRLSLQNGLWGRARSYLEASVGQAPTPEGYRELGALLEQLGEQNKAFECYRKGLEQAVGNDACTDFTVRPEISPVSAA